MLTRSLAAALLSVAVGIVWVYVPTDILQIRDEQPARQIREQGYAVMRGVLTEAEVAEMRAAMEHEVQSNSSLNVVLANGSWIRGGETTGRPWVYANNLPLSQAHSRLQRLGEELLGEPASRMVEQYGGGEIFNKMPMGAEVPPHQDNYWHFYRTRPDGSGGTVRLLVALDGFNERNGCLRYVVGSHRSLRPHTLDPYEMHRLHDSLGLPTLTAEQQTASGIKPRLSGTFELMLQGYSMDDEERAVPVSLQPGDVVAHFPNTIHRSDPNFAYEPRMGVALTFVAESAQLDLDLIHATDLAWIYEKPIRRVKKRLMAESGVSIESQIDPPGEQKSPIQAFRDMDAA